MLLYHYAGAAAADGIVKHGTLWGSKIQFLNDEREFEEYLDFAEKCIRRFERSNATKHDGLQDFCDDLVEQVDRIRKANIFVASFSTEGDLLSQWRGYTPSGGYSLGFSLLHLKEHFEKLGLFFEKAIYEEPEDSSLVPFITAAFEEYASKDAAALAPAERENCFSSFVQKLLKEAPRFKNGGFKEESEWRVYTPITSSEDDCVDVVTIRNGLRPIYYFSLPLLSENPVRDISLRIARVSPGTDMDIRRDALRILLLRRKTHCESIELSAIPYTNR